MYNVCEILPKGEIISENVAPFVLLNPIIVQISNLGGSE